jgi:short subunit dehydrogenase-like uncharacterized protein
MKPTADYDLVIYGATGYTGRLVAEYLYQQYGVNNSIRWAMAGRSMDKLLAVRDQLGISHDIPLIATDSSNSEAVQAMVEQSRVIVTTVGPYQLYGNELIAACAANGTDYVDLCGEPGWMAAMINQHQATAEKSGARLVFSCGFDSVPFDLGVYFLQRAAQQQWGHAAARIKGRVRSMKGTFSGGTIASFKASMLAASRDPNLLAVLNNPFALTPGFKGAPQPWLTTAALDESLDSWVIPFVMATINTKNIHRSNLLLNHLYGKDFVYDELMMTGPGEKGEAIANAAINVTALHENNIQPGEGPSKEEREAGSYDVLFIAEDSSGKTLRASVKGDRDPGYGSSCKMLSESAICLLRHPELASGGVWTPASAMGDALLERLQEHAGLSFQLE